jgi:hypothetical protein
MMESFKDRIRRANERDKRFDQPIERISRLIWPWTERKLVLFVSLLALLDFISTYAALRLSASQQVYEAGFLAKWALNLGGFPGMFLMDAIAISVLILLASGAKALYNRFGYAGFARSAFVFVFIPYFVIIMPIVINNVLLTFR